MFSFRSLIPLSSAKLDRRSRAVRRTRSSAAELLETRRLLTPTSVNAFHRAGQTFVTWNEDLTVAGESYHVYQHTAPITSANLNAAQRLTERWGPLNEDTSVHSLRGAGSPETFVIEDLGTPLTQNQGLFVHTTQAGAAGSYYYAVTQVVNGTEDRQVFYGTNSTGAPVRESVAAPKPILVASANGGRGRVYTQFMDYQNWNPTFQGYAYNYSVALPATYDANQAYPLKLSLHAYTERYRVFTESEFDWPAIQVFVDDPGAEAGTVHTWWYGFAADWNYQTDGPIPAAGVIENFTEQRVLRAIDEVIADPAFNVDTARIHAQGHSMGGSGSLSLGLRYGNVFSGIFASEGMTNYATSPTFQPDFQRVWGTQQSNLWVRNRGTHAGPIERFGVGGAAPTRVYNWMNHHAQVGRMRGLDTAFLMFGHGKSDTIIDWPTQGAPFLSAVMRARMPFTAEQRRNWGHDWMGFSFAPHSLFSAGFGDLGDYIFRDDVSYPAITFASGSGPEFPNGFGTDLYQLDIDWSVPWNNFGALPEDTAARWAMTIRSSSGTQTADVTPRNLQQFNIQPGRRYRWVNRDAQTGAVLAEGTVTADADGLVTVPQAEIRGGSGSRLEIEPDGASQVIGESGITDTVYSEWTRVTLQNSFQDPVIIAGGPGYRGGHAGVLRIRNVQPNSFEIRFQEWNYLDGSHTYESVPWLVVEAGQHVLDNGTVLKAGQSVVNHNWRRVNADLAPDAVVLTSVSSTNGGAPIVPRIRRVDTTGFDALVSEEEAEDQIHYDETLSWVALSAGSETAGGTQLRAFESGDRVGSNLVTVNFQPLTTGGTPVVLSSVITTDGGDPVTIRTRAVADSFVQLFLQEEQSADAEIAHTWENLGMLVLSPGVLTVTGGGDGGFTRSVPSEGTEGSTGVPEVVQPLVTVPRESAAALLDTLFEEEQDEGFWMF